MKSIISYFLVASILLPSISHAEGTSIPVPIPSSSTVADQTAPAMITPLKKSQIAPFSGILFSPRAAAQVATEISSFPERIRIDVEAAVKASEAKKDYERTELSIQCTADKSRIQAISESNAQRMKAFETELKRVQTASPDRTTWFSLGVTAGVIVTVVTVFAVNQASK